MQRGKNVMSEFQIMPRTFVLFVSFVKNQYVELVIVVVTLKKT